MSLTWKLVLDATLSLAGAGFLVWLVWRAWQNSESPTAFVFKTLLTGGLLGGEILLVHRIQDLLQPGSVESNSGLVFLLVGSVAVAGSVLSILWTPHLADFLVSPLTNLFDGGNEPPERKPAYSAAISKRKASRPLEAIVAIREQLARFPNDFKGVMLLANIQAEDMNDLPGAEMTLNHFCNSPGVPDEQVVAALTRLADWHLNKTNDVDSALAIMEDLVARFPEAEVSRRAAERLGRLKGGKTVQPGKSGTKPAMGASQLAFKIRR